MERKITIVSMMFDGLREHRSTARTWGELKQELAAIGVPIDGTTKGMNRATKMSFASDDATLPSEDWTLFLSPADKIKSGN